VVQRQDGVHLGLDPVVLGLRVAPAGFQNSAAGLDLGLLRGSLIFVEEAAEDGPALDPLLGEVGDGVIGPGRAEFAAAVGSLSVVVPGITGEDRPQVPFTEDQHPVGDLGPGGEHEPFRIGIGARRQQHTVRVISTDVCG
jgi:hypothetical protein